MRIIGVQMKNRAAEATNGLALGLDPKQSCVDSGVEMYNAADELGLSVSYC